MDTRQEARAQAALLATLVMHGDYAASVFEIVAPDDFTCYRKIAQTVKAAYDSGKPIDYITVASQLNGDAKTLDDILPEAENIIWTPSNVTEAAKTIAREGRRFRRRDALVRGMEHIAYAASDEELDRAESEIIDSLMVRRNGAGKAESIADVGTRVVEHIAMWNAYPGQTWGLSSGYAALDNMLGGFEDGSLYVLAARPSMGKSSLALGVANNVAGAGHPVLYFSPEMSNEQLFLRLLCMRGLIDSRELKRGRANAELVYNQVDRIRELMRETLLVNDKSAITTGEVRAIATDEKRRRDVKLIVFDYMNLAGDTGESSNKRMGNISNRLKDIAKSLSIPVLALTQLNRSVEGRDSHIPTLADLRDSGEIEEGADCVMFIHRAAYYMRDKPAQLQELQNAKRDKIADIVVAKNRNGAIGRGELYFDEVTTLFSDVVTNGLGNH